MYDVVKHYPRPGRELLNAFSQMQSATLHESMGKQGALDSYIRPAWQGMKVCGSAVTVLAKPGDNLMIHKAIFVAKPGDILMVTTGGFTEAGIMGEIMVTMAMRRGIAGIVTDGSVRDVAVIKELGFPMFSKGISMKGSTKQNPGKINNPVILGGVLIKPGDIVVGDDDGVVAVPLDKAAAVLEAARNKERYECDLIEKIKRGKLDRFRYADDFNKLGLKEEED